MRIKAKLLGSFALRSRFYSIAMKQVQTLLKSFYYCFFPRLPLDRVLSRSTGIPLPSLHLIADYRAHSMDKRSSNARDRNPRSSNLRYSTPPPQRGNFCYPLVCVMKLVPSLLAISMITFCPILGTAQWLQSLTAAGSTKTINNREVLSLVADGDRIYAGTYSSGGGVFLSSDNGQSWLATQDGWNSRHVRHLVRSGSSIFAGTNGGGVSVTTDSGASWVKKNNGIKELFVFALTTVGDHVFVAGNLEGMTTDVFRTTTAGESWFKCINGLPSTVSATSMAGSDNSVFLGTTNHGVFRSVDNGEKWVEANDGLADGVTVPRVSAIAAQGSNVYVAITRGIFHSSNNGSSWIQIDGTLPGNLSVKTIAIGKQGVFIGTDTGLYHTTDSGLNWQDIGAGLMDVGVSSVAVNDTKVFVGRNGNIGVGDTTRGVWCRLTTEFTSDVQTNTKDVVDAPLIQAYPNPFSSSATLRFTLDHSAHVICDVVNALGEIVSQQANRVYDAGTHTLVVQPLSMVRGTFYARLRLKECTHTAILLFAP